MATGSNSVPSERRAASGSTAEWRILAARAISGTGSAISLIVVPILAVDLLGATPFWLAAIALAALVPGLLFELAVGSMVDRSKRHVRGLWVSELTVGCATVIIPISWWLDVLTLPLLVALVGVEAFARQFSGIFSSAVTVRAVPEERFVTFAGQVNALSSATDIAGQGLGGAIMRIVGAPLALIVDGVSSVVGALILKPLRLRSVDGVSDTAAAPHDGSVPPGSPEPTVPLQRIFRVVAGRRDIWLVASVAFLGAVAESTLVIHAIEDLGIAAQDLGLLLAVGAIGGVSGGLTVGVIRRRLGVLTVGLAALLSAIGTGIVAFANSGPFAPIAVVLFELFSAFGGTVLMATVFGQLQAETPPGQIGRVMAVASVCLQIGAMAGLGIGAGVAELASTRAALAVAAVAVLAASLAGGRPTPIEPTADRTE